MTLEQLLELEAKTCRARNRTIWSAQGELTSSDSMLGSMVNYVLQESPIDFNQSSLLEKVKKHFPDDRKRSPGTLQSFNDFLNGGKKGCTEKWIRIAKACLCLLISGTPDGKLPRTGADVEERQKVVYRIIHFFFPAPDPQFLTTQAKDRQETWFFDSRLAGFNSPANGREVWAELRWLKWEASFIDHGTPCRIVRVSGAREFAQADQGKLTQSGNITVNCLLAGVDVYYVVPSNGSGAKKSAQQIVNLMEAKLESTPTDENAPRGELRLVNVSPTEERDSIWAGEFLSTNWVYALYESNRSRMDGPQRTFLFMRDQKLGTSAFTPTKTEIRSFVKWCKTFVYAED
ncbi:hypothetical protein [Roseiconus lacunae]|uniref:Uncharacterized protein n=1 Tax=Roseiconus lacunae TaxID=2605694 RepID=A0ABT7PP06_9BACT|nr:hypothetical protein [Roseiconus lacunae]MDM4018212.1 hypothetical protein [Roseiconus lacunae]